MNLQYGNDSTWLPVWFRLQPKGEVFTAYQSSDGIEWFAVGENKVSLPGSVLTRLLVSGGGNRPSTNRDDQPLGIFDHVTLETQLPPVPAAPTELTAVPLDGGVLRLDWKNAADSTQAGVKVEASVEDAPFYEIADLTGSAVRFENTGIQNPKAIRYRVRAYNRGGHSPYSNATP